MSDGNLTVDVLSLEGFGKNLESRLGEVESMLEKLRADLKGQRPALGGFQDASAKADWYGTLRGQYVQRLERLRSAIIAAQKATADIIANYSTTEERNRANAADIAERLNSVGIALDGGAE